MVIQLPDVESFVAEAKEAGAARVYLVRNLEYRYGNGVPTYRAWVVATAVGNLACHAGGPEKALLRYERDFGPVLQDLRTQSAPQDYRERVERFVEETRAKLAEAGFEVRDGEVTAL